MMKQCYRVSNKVFCGIFVSTIWLAASDTAVAQTYNMTATTVSTCSGNFYDNGGSAGNYTNNQNLTETFTPSTSGNYMQVVFTSFSTEANVDFLTIYDGATTAANIIGTYSTTSSPGTITATTAGGSLTFKFTSNGGTVAAGWVATLSCVALPGTSAGNFPITNSAVVYMNGGTFVDDGGSAANYFNSENKIMTFYPITGGQYVQMIFTSFSTDAPDDTLTIYDGTSTSATRLGTYSGSSTPDTIAARNAIGALTFQFKSNGGTVAAGWAAIISTTSTQGSNSGSYPMTPWAAVTACGGRFYDDGGSSGNYYNSESSVMTFYPATAGQYVQFTFSAFNTDATNDLLTIYDGANTSAPIIGVYSGTVNPGTIGAYNASGCLTFKFISNGGTVAAGWAATFICSATKGSSSGNYPITDGAVVYTCGGNFYDDGGSGANYFNNENQTMTFYPATAGQYVQVTFSSYSTDAANDLLTIYDGTSIAAPLIGIWSGTTGPGTIGATNTSGALTFVFTSNGGTVSSGWAAALSCSASASYSGGNFYMTNGASITTCNATFYDDGGGGNYFNNESKIMTFYPATAGNYIQLNFSSYSTDAGNDFVTIYDGTNTSAPIIATYSGTTSPGVIGATNAQGCLTIQFTSNGSVVSSGWVAAVNCSATPGSTTGNYPITDNAVVTTCGGNFYDSGMAGNYTNNESEIMTFYPATAGNYIHLDFSVFSTQSNTDYLVIYDGPSVSAPVISAYSGSTLPGVIGATNASGCLTIKFFSNGATVGTGWLAAMSCSATPGSSTGNYLMTNTAVVYACGGNFYDAGGATGNYFNNENKTMTFYPATAGNYIHLNFSAFSTVAALDFVSVYDGPNTSSPLIASYTGNTGPADIAATNAAGCLTVTFSTNPSTVSSGWAATISCSSTPGSNIANYEMTNGGTVRACGGNFYDLGGSAGNYVNSENKTMVFKPLNSGYKIALTFTAFSLENINDYISIYDGVTTSAPLIGTYTGSTNPGTVSGTTSNSITVKFVSNGSTVSSGWSATLSCLASALPIQLTSFNAVVQGNDALLNWSTASEIDNDYFTVERSMDAINFERVAAINGAGNSNEPQHYSTIDVHPYSGQSYYRLAMTDYNGHTEYSNIVTVTFTEKIQQINLSVFPNPVFNTSLNVSIEGAANTNVQIVLFDLYGHLFYSNQLVLNDGINTFKIDDCENLCPGIYEVEVLCEDQLYVKKVIVQ